MFTITRLTRILTGISHKHGAAPRLTEFRQGHLLNHTLCDIPDSAAIDLRHNHESAAGRSDKGHIQIHNVGGRGQFKPFPIDTVLPQKLG